MSERNVANRSQRVGYFVETGPSAGICWNTWPCHVRTKLVHTKSFMTTSDLSILNGHAGRWSEKPAVAESGEDVILFKYADKGAPSQTASPGMHS